jgi:hypothetical protein
MRPLRFREELLHVHKVSDCARFFPCKPFAIIKAFRQQRRLLAIRSLNKTPHHPPAIQQGNHSIDGVFTRPGPLAEVSRQRALPRGDAEVAFQRKIINQGLFFRSLDIGFGFAKPRD